MLFHLDGQRKLITHAFSERALKQQEPLLQFYMHLLIGKLHAKIEAGGLIVDLAQWYKYVLFDIIGGLAYGQPFLNLENQADQPWISSAMGGIRLAVRSMQIGAFISLEYILWLLPKSLMAQQLAIFEFTQNRVSERLALETDKPNIMSYIIRHNNEDTGKGLISRGDMDSTFVVLIVAGSDTSATTLSSATYYLTKNPDFLRRLSEEVRSAFPTEDRIIIASASKLPYLLAVLEESLHLHHPVPISLPRVVPPGGAIVSGHWVPGDVSAHLIKAARG